MAQLIRVLMAGLLLFVESQASDVADRSTLQGFLSKYMSAGSKVPRSSMSDYDKFITPNHGAEALSSRNNRAELGPDMGVNPFTIVDDKPVLHLTTQVQDPMALTAARGEPSLTAKDFDPPTIADRKEKQAVQKLLAMDSSNPITLSAIGIGLLSLMTMLGVRLRRGLQSATVLASSGGHGPLMPMNTASALGDNVMEMKTQDPHVSYNAAVLETRPTHKANSSRVGWGQLSSDDLVAARGRTHPTQSTELCAMPDDDDPELFGGYTAKQRMREEIESPFRKIRLLFFGASTGSALLALYFSILNVAKAATGFSRDIPLDEAIGSTAINVVAVLVCAGVTYNDYRAGEKNLERIAQGARLAKLVVSPASAPAQRRNLGEYRRGNRVAICVGGEEYVQNLARSLSADQRADENTLAAQIDAVDLLVVPALVDASGGVNDAGACWRSTTAGDADRNFDLQRSAAVVAFPRGAQAWEVYLKQELETARSQGFDPVEKGLVIVVKKNGRILRRLTGQPPWSSLIGTMEVADGSKFGMPGDDERYMAKALKGDGAL